ncbi:hypothetical protein MJO10_31245, partial [Salmonella enterica subsp. enterica serovar Anatum]|nr:hypothetical protein [Salmonella enterica subsp. enterica serovar Anatum]
MTIVHEAQRARGVPLDEGWYQRLRAMPALIVPLTQNALNGVIAHPEWLAELESASPQADEWRHYAGWLQEALAGVCDDASL